VVACSSGEHGSASTGAASTIVAQPTAATTAASAAASSISASSASASASGSGSASAAKPPSGRTPKSFEALKAELAKNCPVEEKQSNIEQKEAAARAIQCLKKKMTADLDAVLL